MSRNRRRDDSGSGFGTKLTWTILFGLVFGAGLITGQRLIRNQTAQPLISVHSSEASSEGGDGRDSSGAASETSPDSEGDSRDGESPIFSFYDRLAGESDDSKSAAESTSTVSVAHGAAGQPNGTAKEEDDDAPSYTLQISAYPKRKRAKSRLRRLERMGLDPYLVSARLPDEGTYYRVRIGKFSSMEAARTFQRELARKRGVDAVVTPL